MLLIVDIRQAFQFLVCQVQCITKRKIFIISQFCFAKACHGSKNDSSSVGMQKQQQCQEKVKINVSV